MTAQQMLKIMRLLSGLESFIFASNKFVPDYLLEDISDAVGALEAEILESQK